jgi:hypothetical protein
LIASSFHALLLSHPGTKKFQKYKRKSIPQKYWFRYTVGGILVASQETLGFE